MKIEYIWIDADGNLRSKCRTLSIECINNLPRWNFDGSSTGQLSDDKNSEIILIPIALYLNPLEENSYLTLCECYTDKMPALGNNRNPAQKIFDKCNFDDIWFGIEQEYVMMKNNKILGWPDDGEPAPQGPYYCKAAGLMGRNIVEEHYKACITAHINIYGTNAEVMPGQWEYQLGPTSGMKAADELWISRFLLERIAEKYEIHINYDPKPKHGDWNGSGCHTNFSTVKMRTVNGYYKECITNLKEFHGTDMLYYGNGNEKRLSGMHETSSFEYFSSGVGDRSCSIRIPTDTYNNGVGYLEDRRPSSSMDPYIITSRIAGHICGVSL